MENPNQRAGRAEELETQRSRQVPGATRGPADLDEGARAFREEEAARGVGEGEGLTLALDARDPIFDVDPGFGMEDGTGGRFAPRSGAARPGGVDGADDAEELEGTDEEIDVNADAAVPNTQPDPETERNRRARPDEERERTGDRKRGIEASPSEVER